MINFTIVQLVLYGLGLALLFLCSLFFKPCLLGKGGLLADSLFIGLRIFTHLLNLLGISVEFKDVLQCGYLLSRSIAYIFRNMYVSNFDILHRVSVI